ncbi:hypothetical protein Cadr_000008214 [Camelus dromedarius]|uniref:Uncharacterized protein n=1 Tax=Camelus dromedarius TaxID=9838 RepID=A0A5N4DXX6_CAMDR|nr:hypothetical protein Cadr_000008214 [Camelus dromedarius]
MAPEPQDLEGVPHHPPCWASGKMQTPRAEEGYWS